VRCPASRRPLRSRLPSWLPPSLAPEHWRKHPANGVRSQKPEAHHAAWCRSKPCPCDRRGCRARSSRRAIAALVEAGTQMDQTLGLLNQRGSDVRRKCIDGKYMRQALFGCNASRFPVRDTCIVAPHRRSRVLWPARPRCTFAQCWSDRQ
jgi:hypothetical protein